MPKPYPHKVNSWYNPEDNDRGEVWYNGKDGYNIYLNDKRIDTLYISTIPGIQQVTMDLAAVGHACNIGYFRTMKKRWGERKKGGL